VWLDIEKLNVDNAVEKITVCRRWEDHVDGKDEDIWFRLAWNHKPAG
jgi:hypothetical protein